MKKPTTPFRVEKPIATTWAEHAKLLSVSSTWLINRILSECDRSIHNPTYTPGVIQQLRAEYLRQGDDVPSLRVRETAAAYGEDPFRLIADVRALLKRLEKAGPQSGATGRKRAS